MTDANEIERLRDQVAALTDDLGRSIVTTCFLIDLTSACVEAVIQSADVLADARPDIAAHASQIAETWKQFLTSAQVSRAATELQNAPSSDARQ